MDRTILLCDANSFYASVETIMNPELRGHPLAVAGDPKNRHGVVLARNELARKFGVRTTDSVSLAKKKCPDLLIVAPHHEKYEAYSEKINAIYLEYSYLVDPYSIDESYIDITDTPLLRQHSARFVADQIRERVKRTLGLTVSVGASFNRCFAKLACEQKKPDGTTVIPRSQVRNIVWPLPVRELLYVGSSTAAKLSRIGIHTIGDLASSRKDTLMSLLGKHGQQIWNYANGLDDEPVRSYYEPRTIKSVSNSFTFRRDIVGEEETRTGVASLADTVAARLRRYNLKCRTVQVQIKDPQFKMISRQQTLERPTFLLVDIVDTSMEIIRKNWHTGAPIRLLTITCSDLMPAGDEAAQLSMFEHDEDSKLQKREKLESTMADIRNKLGRDSITYGFAENKELGIFRSRTDDESPETQEQ